MAGKEYHQIICAGISAVKWIANKEPERDKQQIKALQDVLQTVSADQFVLISTIDVYPLQQGEDESFDCTQIPNEPYGFHRLLFEQFCMKKFNDCRIIRLPGLFGAGLKKNIIYDLLNDNCLEMINPASSFQYYYLENLWNDIQTLLESDITTINFFTEPIQSKNIIQHFFPGKKVGQAPVPEKHYNLYTQHASLWGKTGHYMQSREEVFTQLETYIQRERGKGQIT